MSVERNLIANYLGAGWTALMGLAFIPLYIHFLGIEAFGLIGVFTTLQAWFALLDFGLTPTLNREVSRFRAGLHTPAAIGDLLRSMEFIYGGIALLLAVMLIVFAGDIASGWLKVQTLPLPAVTQALAIMGALIALRWMVTLYRGVILGLQDQVWLNAVGAGFATVRGLGVVGVLVVVPTIQAFFIFQAVATLAELVVLQRRSYHALLAPGVRGRFNLEELRRVWRFAAGVTLIMVLATLLTQVDKLLLSKLLTLDQFGYFMLATAVAGGVSILISPIGNAIYPRFTELVACGDDELLARQYHQFAQLLSIIVLPVALFMSAFAHDIMMLWTANRTTADTVAPVLAVLVIGTALNGLMHVPYFAQLAYGQTRLGVIVNSIAVAVIVPALLYFVPRHGMMAAASIWVAINAGYVLLGMPAVHARILRGELGRWYRQDVAAPLLAGLAATVLVRLAIDLLPSPGRLALLTYLLVAAGAIFSASALATPLGRERFLRLVRDRAPT